MENNCQTDIMKPVLIAAVMGILVVLFSSTAAFAQNTVSGVVTDAKTGETLPGVNILVKNTSKGIFTNSDGSYELNVPSPKDTLVFTYVGYQRKEVSINGRSTINVNMQQQAISGQELVVVGYGTQRKRDVTGSIASIGADDFNKGTVTAPAQLMEGKLAGVHITSSNGAPGANSVVHVRGTTSISAGNSPLYVIDGVPIETHTLGGSINANSTGGGTPLKQGAPDPLNMINPADIQSINVLKGPSAEAIYGSRAANGVIIIKTKSSTGSLVSYNSYVGISAIPKKLPVLSASEYTNYAMKHNLQYPDKGANTNWQDQVFRTAFTQNHNISIGGGSPGNANYRASLGFMKQNGTIIGTDMKDYNGNFSLNKQAVDGKLDIKMKLLVSKTINDQAALSHRQGGAGGDLLIDAVRWAPTLPVRNADGSYYQIGALRVNPVSWTQITDKNEKDAKIGNFNLIYDFTKWLSGTVNLGYTGSHNNRSIYIPMSNPVGAQQGGRATIQNAYNESYLIETNLKFEDNLNKNSHLKFLGGYSFQRFTNRSTATTANQFPADATKWNLIQSGQLLSSTSGMSANRLSSIYGRFNYQLMNRYLLTLTLRRDGSSRFGQDNKWGFFPSAAIGWIISDEPFFPTKTISNLKIRAEYGVTGNQAIPNNLYKSQLSVGSSIYEFGGEPVASVGLSNYANPHLQWERTSQVDIGLDFGFLNNRFTGTVDYYKKITNNLLLSFSTASPSAVGSQWANVGQVNNKGLEVTLDGVIIRNHNIQWNASVNYSRNRNMVVSLSNNTFSRNFIRTANVQGKISTTDSHTQIIKPGLPLHTFYGRKFTGLDKNGMETYLRDKNGDLVIGPIGNADPDFSYGISSNLTWKRVSFAFTFKGVEGNDIFDETVAEYSYPSVLPGENVLKSALHNGTSRNQQAQFSSRWLENGSYLRLQNLTIGYNFNVNSVSFLSKAHIYLMGQNLFVITPYSGYDPEVHVGGSTGVDFFAYPRARTIQFGVNLNF